MRALILLAALCLASATAFPQARPTVCSIPLLRITPGNIDPLIMKAMPPVSDNMPLVKVPAPPCDEPAAQEPALAQLLGGQRERLMAVMKKFMSERKPAAAVEKTDPVPYVQAPLPGALGESLKP